MEMRGYEFCKMEEARSFRVCEGAGDELVMVG